MTYIKAWLRAFALFSFLVLGFTPQLHAEGSWQMGLSQGTTHQQPLMEWNSLYNNTATGLEIKERPLYIDIMNASEIIDIHACGTADTGDFRIQIYDESGVTLLHDSGILANSNVSCADDFNGTLTAGYEFVPGAAGTYQIRLDNLASTTGNFNRFDVFVKDTAGADVDPRIDQGRLWGYRLAFDTGSFDAINSTSANLYAVVDGGFTSSYYVWELNLDHFAGNVYEIVANDLGLVSPNPDGTIVAALSGCIDSGSVAPCPNISGNRNNVNALYKIYFSKPATSYPRPTTLPEISDFSFLDDAGVDNSISPADTVSVQDTGDFLFNTNLATTGTYTISIDVNNDGSLGAGDVFLTGVATPGANSVNWNGRDNSGVAIPNGSYPAQIVLKTGEFHFTAADAETSGGPGNLGLTINAVLDDGTIDTSNKVYWDDSTYLALAHADSYNGDGTFKYHNWGNFDGAGDGNRAYIDTYTIGNTSAPVFTSIAVEPANTPRAKVIGNVFEDSNGNGVRDSGEIGFGGITITLTEPISGFVFSILTDSNGSYEAFTGETSLTIDVNESMLPVGYIQTAGTDPETVTGLTLGVDNVVGFDGYQLPLPSLSIVKTADVTVDVMAGQTVTYTYEVNNTGNTLISNVTIVDVHSGSGMAPVPGNEIITNTSGNSSDAIQNGSVDVLAQGDSATFASTYIVTQADIDLGIDINNTATADGTPANGTLTPVEDNETVSPVSATPSFTVDKATASVPTAAGETLDYTFTVKNTGNVSLTDVNLTDGKCATAFILDSESLTADTILEVGETQVYSCTSVPVTQAEVDAAEVFNEVSVVVTPPTGIPTPPVEDNLTTPVSATPSFTVDKATASVPTAAGETLDYTFTVKNTGNVSLTDVNLTDGKCATAFILDSESLTADTILEVGETQVYSCTSVPVTQAEVDAAEVFNEVSVVVTPPTGIPTPPVEDNLTTPVSATPSFTVDKATASVPTAAGETLDYTFTVKNTGNVSLTDVNLTDGKCATAFILDSESLTADTILEVGETQVYSCTSVPVTQAEVDAAEVFNEVSVVVTPPTGIPTPPVEDNLTTPVSATPSFTVDKATASVPTAAGETLDYTFTVKNTGNVSLTDVNLTDGKCATAFILDSESLTADTILEVGETQVYSCTSVPVTQAEVDAAEVFNEVSVVVTPPTGIPTPPVEDNLTTPVSATPSFTVDKATASVPTAAGETLDYTFTVKNTGNVSLTDVNLTDGKCATAFILDSESLTADTILEVGETQVYSCTSVPVTQAEVDAAEVFNEVSVVVTPPTGIPTPPVEDNLTTPVSATPSFTVDKATASVPTAAGETLDYTFTVKNTGNVSLTDVNLTDGKCATAFILDSESLTADTILEVGETQVYSCTSVPVTQAEVDAAEVFNEVSVVVTPPTGIPTPPVEDNLTTPVSATPSFTVDKATASVPTAAGETLDYTFTVKNTGNVSLTDVNLTDGKCATAFILDSESLTADTILEVGETQVYSCTSVPVTQAEVDAAEVFNEVSVVVTPPTGIPTPPVEDNLTTPVSATPSFTVDKATASVPTAAGETLDYTFTVKNTGNVSLTDVNLTDGKCATAFILDSESLTADTILEVGETQVYSCTSVPVTQAEVDAAEVFNEVSVVVTPPTGIPTPPVEDNLTTPVSATPSFTVDKATASVPTAAGETLDYTFTVKNTGNVSLTDVNLTDGKCATAFILDSESLTADTILEVGETQVYSCTSVPVTQAEVDAAEVFNEVSVVVTPPTGIPTPPVEDNLTTPVSATPSFTVDKATASVPTAAGETLDYTFTVKNTGNVSLTDVNLTDGKCATAFILDSESLTADTILEVGETQVYSCTSVPVTQAEVDAAEVFNEVSVVVTPPTGIPTPPVEDNLTTPVSATPSFTVDKATASVPTAAGETLDYTFTVKNTGNVSLTDVNLTDGKCATAFILDSESLTADTILEVGETQVYSCTSVPVTQAEVDAAEVFNEVSVVVTPPTGIPTPPVEDNLTTPVSATPSFTVDKATASVPTAAGETLDYTFTVKNTGNVSLTDVNLTDGKCATAFILDSESLTADTILEVGETQVYSCTSVPVTQAEVDAAEVFNEVSVVVTPPTGIPTPPVEDNLTTPVSATPSFTVDKATASVPTAAGETLDYTFTVKNTGNVSLTDVNLTDGKCATAFILDSESLTADTILEVGETQVYSCTSVPVTQAEVDAAEVFNEVSVVVTPPTGIPTPPVEDNLTTPVSATPSFTVDKATASVPTAAGETLDYTFTVKNTGNVSLTDVNLTDGKCATAFILDSESLTADTILEVGETQVYSCTSVPVTQAEVDAAEVFNEVSVVVTPPTGIPTPPVEDNLTTPVSATPSFTVDKATASVPTAAGETLDYTFTVKNTGNVSLTDVNLTDGKCATAFILDSESLTADTILEVGETQVYSCTSVPVTQAEVDAAEVFNEVSVVVTPPTGIPTPPVEDNLTTPVSATPLIDIVKTGTFNDFNNDGYADVNETITYTFVVTNIGNVSLTNVIVADNNADVFGGPISLAAGESDTVTFTGVHSITLQDLIDGEVLNQAIVIGTDPDGNDANDTSDDPTTSEDEDPTIVPMNPTPPTSENDVQSVGNGEDAIIDIINNDTAGAFPLDPVSVTLTEPTNVTNVQIDTEGDIVGFDVPGEGSWRVDEITGVVTFSPEDGYAGDPTPIEYTVADTQGNKTTSEISINYPPVANNDSNTSLPEGETAILSPIGNDEQTSTPLNPESINFVVPASATGTDTDGDRDIDEVVVPSEGIWTANPDGTVIFDPDGDLEGNPTPINYTITEISGDVSNEATLSVTYVGATVSPGANDDDLTVNHYGSNIGTVVNNDTAGVGEFEEHTYQLINQEGDLIEPEVTISTEHGTVSMDLEGTYTYAPEANYNGSDFFEYVIIDTAGQEDNATVNIDVDCASTQTSDSGDALGITSMLAMLFFTLITGLYFRRREERGND